MKWERTFEFSGPIDKVWRAFTDPEVEYRMFNAKDAYKSGGAVKIEIGEQKANELLEWKEIEGDRTWDMSVSFEDLGTGTRITIVRSGFGDGDEWMAAGEGRLLGWEHMLRDLEVFFRTGVMLHRLYTTPWGRIGIGCVSDGGGMRILSIAPESSAAAAGMQVGDVVVGIDEFPVYGASDLWLIERAVDPDVGVRFEYIRDGKLATSSGRVGQSAAAAAKA